MLLPLIRDVVGIGMGAWCMQSQIMAAMQGKADKWIVLAGFGLIAPATFTAAVKVWRGSLSPEPGQEQSSPPRPSSRSSSSPRQHGGETGE
jgi:hypothetical protein